MTNQARRHPTPEAVLQDPELTPRQKIDLLRGWEYDEREIAVAVEEGMPGPEPILLDRIVRALERLEEGRDVEHTAPTKQGGSMA